jgi:hypothetical protein
MKPVPFLGSNVVYAKDQPEYLPLPAHRSPGGDVTTCWQLSWWERLTILLYGHLWLTVMTFNGPLQPLRLSVHRDGGRLSTDQEEAA